MWAYYTDYRSDHPNDYSRGILFPYVKNTMVFTCPDAVGHAGMVGGNSGSYGLNMYLFGARINGTETDGIAMSAAEVHTQPILIGDAAIVSQGKLRGNDTLHAPTSGEGDVHGRHNRMADVVWLDGQVKAMQPVCG